MNLQGPLGTLDHVDAAVTVASLISPALGRAIDSAASSYGDRHPISRYHQKILDAPHVARIEECTGLPHFIGFTDESEEPMPRKLLIAVIQGHVHVGV